MKKSLYSSLGFLILWTIMTTVVAVDHPRVQSYIAKFKNEEAVVTKDTNAEYTFVSEFLKSYYNVNSSNLDRATHTKSIASKLDENQSKSFLDRYKRNLEFFLKEKGSRKILVQEVIYDEKTESFLVLATVDHQKRKQSSQYKVKIIVKTSTNTTSKQLQILEFDEQLLYSTPNEFKQKTVFIKEGVTSTVKLPCNSTAVRSVRNDGNIEIKILSNRRLVEFYPKDPLADSSEFKALCGKRVFKIRLKPQKGTLSMFHSMMRSDGYIEKTAEERFFQEIERENRDR